MAALRQQSEENARNESERSNMFDAMVKMGYNESDFKQTKECAICMLPFEKDEQVTPLPCNMNHCFHEACIAEWLKTNPSCPNCRAPVTS